MLEKIIGFQGLFFAFVCAKLLDNATQIGFLGAIVFGGIPALFGMGMLFFWKPKLMLAVGTVFWLVAGYTLADGFGAEGGTFAAILALIGGFGVFANMQLATLGMQECAKIQMNQPDIPRWTSPLRGELEATDTDLLDCAQGLARLFNIGVLQPATYARIGALLPSHGEVAPVDPKSEAGSDRLYQDFNNLTYSNLIAFDEENEAMERLIALTEPGDARRAAVAKAADRAAAQEAPTPFPLVARRQAGLDPAAVEADLRHLAGCGALSMDSFARAMLKFDPAFDPRAARLEVIPQEVPHPDAPGMAKRLCSMDLISLGDLQGALDTLVQRRAG